MCGWGSWAHQMRPPWVWARQVGPPMVDASLRGLSLLLDTGPRQGGVSLGQRGCCWGALCYSPWSPSWPLAALALGGRESEARVTNRSQGAGPRGSTPPPQSAKQHSDSVPRSTEHMLGGSPRKKVSGGPDICCGEPRNQIWGLLYES